MTAGILNVRDEWPLSNQQLYKYAEEKYGIENLTATHHYETKEIKDSKGRLILPAGKEVNEDFEIKYYDNENVTKSGDDVRRSVGNYEYETVKNNKKSLIYLLKPSYLQQFLNDMRQIMIYDRSSQYVSEDLIVAENTRVTSP